jgi:hypothetical protein
MYVPKELDDHVWYGFIIASDSNIWTVSSWYFWWCGVNVSDGYMSPYDLLNILRVTK